MKKTAVIIFALLFLQCDSIIDWAADGISNRCEEPDYSDCNTVEPFKDFLHVRLTINDENPMVELTVYEGDYENNFIVSEIEADKETEEIEVLLGQSYTVTAKYVYGSDTIMVIDNTNFKKKKKSYCDSTCWKLKGGDIDVSL